MSMHFSLIQPLPQHEREAAFERNRGGAMKTINGCGSDSLRRRPTRRATSFFAASTPASPLASTPSRRGRREPMYPAGR